MLSDRDYMRPDGGPHYTYRSFGGRRESLILPLIIANVIVYFLTGFGRNPLVGLLWLDAVHIRRFELWRFGTYLFVHGSFGHIFWNMWGLYMFGRWVEQRLGPGRFLRLYFVSGFIGGLCWLLFNWNSRTPVVGASGAVFGVMMAAAIMFPNARVMLLFPPVPMRLKTFVAMYAIVEIVLEFSGGARGIAHIAHLGGLLGAFLYMRSLTGNAASGRLRRDLLRNWLRRFFRPPAATGDSSGSEDDAETGGDDSLPHGFSAEVDRILDKIGRQGIHSLTPRERRILDEARERLRRRHGR